MLTVKRLKEVLDYNSDTGLFTWKVQLSNKGCVGNIAGTICSGGYVSIGIDNSMYRGHRLAWLYVYGKWPKKGVDHIDQNKSNNKISNLREADHAKNAKNWPLSKHNKSGVTGVFWNKEKNGWDAGITINRVKIHLGRFKDKFEAICARKSANNKYGFHHNHGMIK